jgi:hypothetical protein
VILRIFNGRRLAEIILNLAVKPISVVELVHMLLVRNITAVKIIRTQTAQESPPSAVCDPTGERAK